MTRKEFIKQIQEALQREEALTEETKIQELREWDSLTAISIIALYDSLFSFQISHKDIDKFTVIKDMVDIVKDRLEN